MSMNLPSDCELYQKLLSTPYDALPPQQQRALEDHLDNCSACTLYKVESDQLCSLLNDLPVPEMKPGIPPQLEQLLRRNREEFAEETISSADFVVTGHSEKGATQLRHSQGRAQTLTETQDGDLHFQVAKHLREHIVFDPYQTQSNQIIGEYRLERKLGGGGFSVVYLAEHIRDHSQVALKILQVPLTRGDDFRDFLNETRTMIRLHHPHIIPLLDVGLSRDDLPFLAMEYASQGTLRDRHPKGTRVPLATIAEYVEQIASALQYAHDHRIIHRDVKPENMLLHVDGTLLLSDFGIAKIMEQSTLMSMQTEIGTPVYMAPEQHMGRPCFASDQYSLGIVVYEWISGRCPFQGTSHGLAIQHMTVPPTPLLDSMPMLPASIERVIFKALSKEPAQRFAMVQEFATAFSAAVQETKVLVADVRKKDNNRRAFPVRIGLLAIDLYLLWFGFFGCAFLITTHLSRPIVVLLALVCSVVLSRIILVLLKLILPKPASTKPDFTNLEGRKGKVSITIPKGGVGEIVYISPGGSRRSRAARSIDGRRFARGQEIVVDSIQDGVTIVKERQLTHQAI